MALLGIQPFSKHLPPNPPSPNNKTFLPWLAAILAEGNPEVPAPIIIKS